MKDLFAKLKKDNRGASLLLVLLVAAFVSMLSMLILLATVTNAKMKSIDKISTGNLQVADSAVEELTIGLESIADEAMRAAYTQMLQLFSTTVQSQRLEKLQTAFSNEMVERIKLEVIEEVEGENKVDIDKIRSLISGASKGTVTVVGDAINCPTYKVEPDHSVVIKGIKISYVDDNGFETVVTTDIRFSIPQSLVDVSKISDDVDFSGYALVTDGTLSNTGGITNISGSVYAAKDLYVSGNGNQLNLSGDYIVSRGAIKAANAGKFSVTNVSTDIWVKNIQTVKGSGINTPSTWIDINGNCYVADDLSLLADYGNVVISGSYYGYHTTNATSLAAGDASGSSAVVVNGAYASLDLSGCSEVLIAGKTYLSVPNYYSALTESELADKGLGVVDYKTFLQGESLSFKGVQSAYMVPGNCILGINHNPMTVPEFEALNSAILAGSTTKRVYLGQNVKEGGVNLEDYVDPVTPYLAKNVQYIGSNGKPTTVVYLYLNFTSPNKAAEYFYEYFNNYGVRVENSAKFLHIGEILLGANVHSTGNLIVNASNVLNVIPRNHDYADSSITKQEISYARKFNGLITFLDEYYYTNDTLNPAGLLLINYETPTADGIKLVNCTADYLVEGQKDFAYTDEETAHEAGNRHPFVLVTPYNVEITKQSDKYLVETKTNGGTTAGQYVYEDVDNFDGLIISAGTIKLTDVKFNGMMIARDDVSVYGNCTLTNHAFEADRYPYKYRDVDEDGILMEDYTYSYLMNVEELIKHDKNIYKWFKTYNPSGVEDSNGAGENGVKIVFENWKKNN